MFFRKAALRPIPRHAIVERHVIDALESTLDGEEQSLQDALDRGYAELDRRQPTMAAWVAEVLSETKDELVQSVGYFLAVTVYMCFRDAFPRRLVEVGEETLRMADETLRADEELRAADPREILDSDDVLALRQPAIVGFLQHHVSEAVEQGEDEIDLDELDLIYRLLLVQIIALSDAVSSPSGEVGPPREMLA